MPPARKDPPPANDPSLPSTSRAFSPSLVPPPKRARTSTGGGPSSSRRQSTGMGGKQARIEDFIDQKDLQDRLLFASMQTADEIMNEEVEEGKEKIEIEKEVLIETAQIVWNAVAEDWATDLVAFSRHAGRETIRDDDVKLLMRRNPEMLAEILAECGRDENGEGATTTATIKRRSTGGLLSGRARKEARDDETELFDDVTTPQGASSSMDSVVPETPQGIAPLAHSTPMNGKSVSKMMRAREAFPFPSPIQEDQEEEEEEEEDGRRKREGRKPNRSILNDLSATMTKENGEEEEGRSPGVLTQEMDEDFTPSMIDLRHPREQEEEERRMRIRKEGEGELNQQPGPSKNRHDYGGTESPELFEEDGEEKMEEEHDSFDDDVVFEEKKNEGKGRGKDGSDRMSESSVMREMLDDEEEEKEKEKIMIDKNDSFDDDSIQFVEMRKDNKKVTSPLPIGDFPSTSAAGATVQQSSGTAVPVFPSEVAARAAPVGSITSQRSSQDSFYNDEILDDPPPVPPVSVSSSSPTVQQPPAAAALQPVRPDDYDSFDDDDDDFVAPPTRSKDNILTPKAIVGPSPKSTVANRWSTVEVEEVVSPAAEKKSGNSRGTFAEDVFGLKDITAQSKPTPISGPSPTVPSRPSPAVTVHQKPSPTVLNIPPSTVLPKPAVIQSSVKNTPVNKEMKASSAVFSNFSFFEGNSPAEKTPTMKREDSDFLDTPSKPKTSTSNTPRGRGGARGGRGFPRKVDPNSKVNRIIREQSTPVRLSPRHPSRISDVVGSFDDDDFDVSGFDD